MCVDLCLVVGASLRFVPFLRFLLLCSFVALLHCLYITLVNFVDFSPSMPRHRCLNCRGRGRGRSISFVVQSVFVLFVGSWGVDVGRPDAALFFVCGEGVLRSQEVRNASILFDFSVSRMSAFPSFPLLLFLSPRADCVFFWKGEGFMS